MFCENNELNYIRFDSEFMKIMFDFNKSSDKIFL